MRFVVGMSHNATNYRFIFSNSLSTYALQPLAHTPSWQPWSPPLHQPSQVCHLNLFMSLWQPVSDLNLHNCILRDLTTSPKSCMCTTTAWNGARAAHS